VITTCPFSLAPLLRGEGRGEGQAYPRIPNVSNARCPPPPPPREPAPTSPRKERGEVREVAPLSQPNLARANLNALPITLTEDNAIAAAPIIGDSRMPNTGYSTPAAIGTPAAL
jgi:hypothetical protein